MGMNLYRHDHVKKRTRFRELKRNLSILIFVIHVEFLWKSFFKMSGSCCTPSST